MEKGQNMKYSSNILFKQIIVFVMLLGAQFAILAGAIDREEVYSGVDSIKLNTISGDLELVNSMSGDVEVKVTSTHDEDSFQIKMEQKGTVLTLSEKSIRNRYSSGVSKWIVGIPDGMKLQVQYDTASGAIYASDISVNLDINTASGDITLSNFTGNVDGNTASGDIKLKNINGSLDLNTASGDVKADSIEGDYKLNTASGEINVTTAIFNDNSSFNSASGDVEVSLNQSPMHDLELKSASGNVELNTMGFALQGQINMTTRKGFSNDIDAPFAFDKIEEYERYGNIYITKSVTLGDPSIKIILSTSSGDATIKD
ncbi:MAG: DUF4097 domain-containing protein [Gammaproteobacteria bacterium]|nr:DUF4097 domain-containing protein [Gammaproteobacteria bacterium]